MSVRPTLLCHCGYYRKKTVRGTLFFPFLMKEKKSGVYTLFPFLMKEKKSGVYTLFPLLNKEKKSGGFT